MLKGDVYVVVVIAVILWFCGFVVAAVFVAAVCPHRNEVPAKARLGYLYSASLARSPTALHSLHNNTILLLPLAFPSLARGAAGGEGVGAPSADGVVLFCVSLFVFLRWALRAAGNEHTHVRTTRLFL